MQAVPVHLVEVPLSAIRCDAKAVHVREGWGGKPIDAFPITRFFVHRVYGDDTRDTRDAMARWMVLQWVRYRDVPKALGGMRGGSFSRIVAELAARSDLDAAGVIEAAARRRADERLALLESIRAAYEPRPPHACGTWIDGCFHLVDGHHRAAALWALRRGTIVCETLFAGDGLRYTTVIARRRPS